MSVPNNFCVSPFYQDFLLNSNYIQGPAGKLRLFITIFKIAEKWIQKQKKLFKILFLDSTEFIPPIYSMWPPFASIIWEIRDRKPAQLFLTSSGSSFLNARLMAAFRDPKLG